MREKILVRKKRGKRGYPVALLIGIENRQISIWKIFSQIAKFHKGFPFEGFRKDNKSNYNFFETIIDSIRPSLREGIKSIIISTPSKTKYADILLSHIKQHHSWLTQGNNKVSFSQIVGSTNTKEKVRSLIRNNLFQNLISETAIKETDNLISILDRNLASPNLENKILFSFEEISKLFLNNQKQTKSHPEILLLTDNYLKNSKHKNQLNSILQIAKNRKVKTRVVLNHLPAGKRLTQLGGLVCLIQKNKTCKKEQKNISY